jgi:spermidine/putrescine transport system ATP-binding protein
MTVAQNIGFGPRMAKVAQSEINRRVDEMLTLISLPGFGNRMPKQLSGGQQQRIALARALINEPAVLLLDEPLGALDLKIRKQLQGELRNIQRKVGITFVYVTHDQEEAMVLSDRIAVMERGRVVQEDTPMAIYHHPVNRFVANFIGESNFFHGTVRERAGDQALLEVPGFARPVRAARRDAGLAPLQVGQQATVMVRPERMAWGTADDGNGLDNWTEGGVRKAAFLGMYTQIVVELAGGSTATIHHTGEGAAQEAAGQLVGQRVTIGWRGHDGQVLTE